MFTHTFLEHPPPPTKKKQKQNKKTKLYTTFLRKYMIVLNLAICTDFSAKPSTVREETSLH